MVDVQLVFLQYVGKTPSLAGCPKCRLKFFTPEQLLKQPEAAAQYLREKFSLHTCKWEIVEETGSSLAQFPRPQWQNMSFMSAHSTTSYTR